MFSNIPQVTKNILILNGLFFLATFVLQNQGIDLIALFGAHYVNSPLFKPYQIITYFFMHSNTDILHIVFNMLLLVMFGSNLERIWGPKRFFIFYIASAIGAFALYNIIGVYEINQLKNALASTIDIETINNIIKDIGSTQHTEDKDSSRIALNYILDKYKPEKWYFAHFHKDVEYNYKGTKLFGLNQQKFCIF
jgi:hypothetical protein